MAAGWHWAKAAPADDAVEDYRNQGVELPPEAVEFMKSQRPADFEVWPENWEPLETFMLCATQWRYFPMGGAQGLDYAAVRAVLQMHGVLDQSAALLDLRLLECGALAAMRGKPLDELIYG